MDLRARAAWLKVLHSLSLVLCGASLVAASFGVGVWIGATFQAGPKQSPSATPLQQVRRIAQAEGSRAAVIAPRDRQRNWVDVRLQPAPQATRVSQALVGESVEEMARRGEWTQVRLPEQQVQGWVPAADLTEAWDVSERAAWQVVVRAPGTEGSGNVFLPFGARLPLLRKNARHALLQLPDGAVTAVDHDALRPLEPVEDLAALLERLKGFRGRSYQSGANSAAGLDGSGLVFLLYRAAGFDVPREEEALHGAGREIPLGQAMPGDVLYLSTFDPRRPQPAVLLDHGETYLEASPSRGVGVGALSYLGSRRILSVKRYGREAGRPEN